MIDEFIVISLNSILITMILNSDISILLPEFIIEEIVHQEIDTIEVSLFVLKFDNRSSSDSVHITINPFDINNNTIEDGLSKVLIPSNNCYLRIELPIELFKRIIGTNKRLLLKSVNPNQELIFDEDDISGKSNGPILTINYSAKQAEKFRKPILKGDLTLDNIENATIILTDNSSITFVNNKKKDTIKEGLFGKLFWSVLIPIIVTVLSAILVIFLGF